MTRKFISGCGRHAGFLNPVAFFASLEMRMRPTNLAARALTKISNNCRTSPVRVSVRDLKCAQAKKND